MLSVFVFYHVLCFVYFLGRFKNAKAICGKNACDFAKSMKNCIGVNGALVLPRLFLVFGFTFKLARLPSDLQVFMFNHLLTEQ